ncbi:4-hydroxy-3-methylbut-2-enyl diphosphate reductase, partial [Candidatus Peregrinibacteria bacterium RIFOXYC2_FULL_33_13]
PRGFCAGVSRAIQIVEKTLEIFGSPLYVRHQIVHNNDVVRNLKKKGVKFVENLEEVPEGSLVVLSAHGSSPEIKEGALKRNLRLIDATCPLVTKVHLEAKKFANDGYNIILIGHRGHQEVLGTMGVTEMDLVENVKDIEKLKIKNEKIAFITQTTLSIDDTREIIDVLKKKYPKIVSASKGDICYATQNRQNAVKKLALKCELILVIGASHSSNSMRLLETAKSRGVESYLIENHSQIKKIRFNEVTNLGITAGASVPEKVVQEVLKEIKNIFPKAKINNLKVSEENIIFPLPKIDLTLNNNK